MQQAVVFPTSVQAAAVSMTPHGVASRLVLFALTDGRIAALDKRLLDARSTAMRVSEGELPMPTAPSSALLDVPGTSIVNYNQSVWRVRGICTGSTGLESTSLAFAYGLDMFFTQLMPRNRFDALSADFNRPLLLVTVGALLLAVVVTQLMHHRQRQLAAWR